MMEYDDIIVTRKMIQSGGVGKTESHKRLTKKLPDGNDCIKVFYQKFHKKKSEPHSSLVVVHGIAEHSQRYNWLGYKCAQAGYEVHMVDFRSYGRSGGARGAAREIGEFHEDIIACLEQTNKHLPLFIFAHSMGGGVIATFLLRNPQLRLAGVVFSGPYVHIDPKRSGLDEKAQAFVKLSAPLLGSVVVSADIGPNLCVRKENGIEMLLYDNKIFPFVSMHHVALLIRLSDSVQDHIKANKLRYNCPILVMYGQKDIVVPWYYTEAFFEAIQAPSKKLYPFREGLHEFFQDYERDEF